MQGFEQLNILIDDGTGQKFDEIVHANKALRDGGVLTIATKDKGTTEGNAGVCLSFSVEMPDGSFRIAQTVTSWKLLHAAVKALEGHYDDEGKVR